MRDRTAIGYGAIYGVYLGMSVNYTFFWGNHWWLGLPIFILSFYWLAAFDVAKR